MKNITLNLFVVLLTTLTSCQIHLLNSKKNNIPNDNFNLNLLGDIPDYSDSKYWIENPENSYNYLSLPKNYTDTLFNSNPEIDVFFVHPTLYTKGDKWNADINDKDLNERIGNSAIKNQASVFLGIANIYAPHYRQMHIYSYTDLKNGLQAYDVAYSDVKNAFIYYWKNYNKGKSFILAGHSQGTNHIERLLKDLISQNDTMRNLLILSYLPGMPIKPFSEKIPACTSTNQLQCYLSWRTLSEGYFPENWESNDSISCVNPISWSIDTIVSNKKNHLGILFQNNRIQYPKSVAAYVYNSVIWIKPIKIPFARFYRMENYHIADYNLYWLNIRSNLRYRLEINGFK